MVSPPPSLCDKRTNSSFVPFEGVRSDARLLLRIRDGGDKKELVSVIPQNMHKGLCDDDDVGIRL